MKFSHSALAAAFAVGSAVAVPMNAARDYHHEPPLNGAGGLPIDYPQEPPLNGAGGLPVPIVTVTKYLPGIFPSNVPGLYPSGGASSSFGTGYPKPTFSNFPALPPPASSVEVPSATGFPTVPSASASVSHISISHISASLSPAPTGVPDHQYGPENIITIIKKLSSEVIHTESLIEIDIKIINDQIINLHTLDTKVLLAAIVSLKVHLNHVLSDIVPALEHAKEHPDVLIEADLKIVLALLHKVQIIVRKVEHILKKIVYTVKADVLLIIGAELHDVIRLVLPITGRIVKVVLALVVYADVHSSHAVDKVTHVVNSIINITSHITGLLVNPILVPVFQHISEGREY